MVPEPDIVDLLEALSYGRPGPEVVLEDLVERLAAIDGVDGCAVHVRRHGSVIAVAQAGGDTSGAAAEGAIRQRETVQDEGVVAVPLEGRDGVVGALTVAGTADVGGLRTVVAVAALALSGIGAQERRRTDRRTLAASFRKITRVIAGTDVRPALQSLVEDAAALIGCSQLVVLERTAEGVTPAAGTGVALDVLQAGTLPEAAVGRPLHGGVVEPLVLLDDADLPPVADLVGGPTAVIAVCAVPSGATGALVAGWPRGHVPDDGTVLLANALADLIGLGLRTAHAQSEIDEVDLEQTREDFLATLSHELRTPLAVIKGAVETIQSHGAGLSEDLRDQLIGRIRQRVDQEVELVETLLSLSRLDRGQMQLQREPFDLAEVITEVATQHMEVAGRSVELDVPDEVPVVADRIALRQVLSHLIGNALKFGRERAHVTVTREPYGWRVAVDDDGEGIPPAIRDRIFERFVQAAPMSHRAGGVGVGLAVVRGFVELHGGQVGVSGSPLGGARFWFEIPDA